MVSSFKKACNGDVFKLLCWTSILCAVFMYFLIVARKSCDLNSSTQRGEFSSKRLQANTSAFVDLTSVPYAEMELSASMTPLEIDAMFFMFISRLHYICKNTVRLGNAADGGWGVCLAGPYRPSTSCLVYSFGISNEWSFDDAVVKNFGCTVRAFDPSMTNVEEHVRGTNIHFHRIGLGGKDYVNEKKWKIKSLTSIVTMLGDENKIIDYLKFDIENAEYESIQSFVNSSVAKQLLQHRVKQVGFEVHIEPTTYQPGFVTQIYNAWNILSQFERKLGFRRWYFGYNPYNFYDVSHGIKRSHCYEVVYINPSFLLTPSAS